MEDNFSTDGGRGMVQAVIRAMGSGRWSFTCLPLTSCCAALFLPGCRRVPVCGPGVGDPCFRWQSVTLGHRLSLPEKLLNDSADSLVTKRQAWPLPLPPPSNTQLVNNLSNIPSSQVGNPVLYILNSKSLKMILFFHARGDSVVLQQKPQSESNFHPCRWLGLIHFLTQVRTKHFAQSS